MCARRHRSSHSDRSTMHVAAACLTAVTFACLVFRAEAAPSTYMMNTQVDCTTSNTFWQSQQSYYPCFCVSTDASNRPQIVYINGARELWLQPTSAQNVFTGTLPERVLIGTFASGTVFRAMTCANGRVALAFTAPASSTTQVRLWNVRFGGVSATLNTLTGNHAHVITAMHTCTECQFPRWYAVSPSTSTLLVISLTYWSNPNCANPAYIPTYCDPFDWYAVEPTVQSFSIPAPVFSSYAPLPYSSTLSPNGYYFAYAFLADEQGGLQRVRVHLARLPGASDPNTPLLLGSPVWGVSQNFPGVSLPQGFDTLGGFVYTYTTMTNSRVWLVLKSAPPSQYTSRSPYNWFRCHPSPDLSTISDADLPNVFTFNTTLFIGGDDYNRYPFDKPILWASPAGCWPSRHGLRVFGVGYDIYTPSTFEMLLDQKTATINTTGIMPSGGAGWENLHLLPPMSRVGVRPWGSGSGGTYTSVVGFAIESPTHPDTWFVNVARLGTTGVAVVHLDPIQTASPTPVPTSLPTPLPTAIPSTPPTPMPTRTPTPRPSALPTTQPSARPTEFPTHHPTAAPSAGPTPSPTRAPSAAPSARPTSQPTSQPSAHPSAHPTVQPSAHPTLQPSAQPTALPTMAPTVVDGQPTPNPTTTPTHTPSVHPTAIPSSVPTVVPTPHPTAVPSASPSAQPTSQPTAQPTAQPTSAPRAVQPVYCTNSSLGAGVVFPNETFVCEDTSVAACRVNASVTCRLGSIDWPDTSVPAWRCGAFVRKCTETEESNECPPPPCNCVCTMRVYMASPSLFELHSISCVNQSVAVNTTSAPSATCTSLCGPGTAQCSGPVPPFSNCVCQSDTMTDVNNLTPFRCPGNGKIYVPCTTHERLLYCGTENTYECRRRLFMAHPTTAAAVSAYFDPSSLSVPTAVSLVGYWDWSSPLRLGNSTPPLIEAAMGHSPLYIPECLCMTQGVVPGGTVSLPANYGNDDSRFQTTLPRADDPYITATNPARFPPMANIVREYVDVGAYDGPNRFVFAHCAASYIPAMKWRDPVTGSPSMTQNGFCNGVGIILWTSTGANNNQCTPLRQFFSQGPPTPLSVIRTGPTRIVTHSYFAEMQDFWWVQHSHVLLDVYSGQATRLGYAASASFLADWIAQPANGAGTVSGARYLLIRASDWDCERDYLQRVCGSSQYQTGSSNPPLYQRCVDPRLFQNIAWASNGLSLTFVRHPVLQCIEMHNTSVLCTEDEGNGIIGCIKTVPGRLRTRSTSSSNCLDKPDGCHCPPSLGGVGCTIRTCENDEPRCRVAFVGTSCSQNGTTCILPVGHTGRAGCVNGIFLWWSDVCSCDMGWDINETTGACTVPQCTDGALRQRCNAAGGTCVTGNVCGNCPFGRWGDDCTGVRNESTGYWGGMNGTEPRSSIQCINGRSGVDALGDIRCVCDDGWGGEDCSISLCPIVNGRVCAGNSICSRPTQSAPFSCQRMASDGTCVRQGCISSLTTDGTGFPRLNASVGGCACHLSAQDYCLQPGATQMCSGLVDGNGCSVCRTRSRPNTTAGVQDMFCDCSAATNAGRFGTYCEKSTCVAPNSGTECSGRGVCVNATQSCRCYPVVYSFPLTQLGVGPFCADAATSCLVQVTSSMHTICNSEIGSNPCVFNGTEYACQCNNGMSSSSRCTAPPTQSPTPAPTRIPTSSPTARPTSQPTPHPTPVPTVLEGNPTAQPTSIPSPDPTVSPSATPSSIPTGMPSAAPSSVPSPGPTIQPGDPTPHPTRAPTAHPTQGPTNVPTLGPGSVLDSSQCPGYCAVGICTYNPSNVSVPMCVCPYPSVYTLNPLTRDCTISACVNNTEPAPNRSACVCTHPSFVQISPTSCRPPHPCASSEGLVCGPLHPLDTIAAGERCKDGQCSCTGLYANATSLPNTTCVTTCSVNHTIAFSGGACVCDPAWSADDYCLVPTCNESALSANSSCVTRRPTARPTSSPTPMIPYAPTASPTRTPTAAPTPNATGSNATLLDTPPPEAAASEPLLSEPVIAAIVIAGLVVVAIPVIIVTVTSRVAAATSATAARTQTSRGAQSRAPPSRTSRAMEAEDTSDQIELIPPVDDGL